MQVVLRAVAGCPVAVLASRGAMRGKLGESDTDQSAPPPVLAGLHQSTVFSLGPEPASGCRLHRRLDLALLCLCRLLIDVYARKPGCYADSLQRARSRQLRTRKAWWFRHRALPQPRGRRSWQRARRDCQSAVRDEIIHRRRPCRGKEALEPSMLDGPRGSFLIDCLGRFDKFLLPKPRQTKISVKPSGVHRLTPIKWPLRSQGPFDWGCPSGDAFYCLRKGDDK